MICTHCKNSKISTKHQVYNKGFSPIILDIFSQYEMLISLECAVDSEWNDVINSVVSCSIVELVIHKKVKNLPLTSWKYSKNISATIHARAKLFVLFCSAQDGESAGMNCLVFWAHCKNTYYFQQNTKSIYNQGIFTNFGYFCNMTLKCAVVSSNYFHCGCWVIHGITNIQLSTT